MTEYIHRDMALARLTEVEVTDKLATITAAKRALADMPAADVVPVSELRELRDALYEDDQLTMQGLARINRVIENCGRGEAPLPVVRCKDCKYSAQAKWNRKGFRICPASHMEIVDDDFCSYAERKEATSNETDRC